MKKIYLAVFVSTFYFCYAYAQVICLCDDGITNGCFSYIYSCNNLTSGACGCSNDVNVEGNCVNEVSAICPKKPNNHCIAAHQTVLTHKNSVKMIKDLALGDKVLTENGFQDYIGNIHKGGISPTIIIYTEEKNNIELTYDHFIKTNNGFLHAHKIIIGDVVITKQGKNKVTGIKNSTSYVMSPFTRSGTIIVNNVILSCYATDRSHYLANIAFLPVRTGMINNVEKYFDTLLYIFDKLPMWAKPYISTS